MRDRAARPGCDARVLGALRQRGPAAHGRALGRTGGRQPSSSLRADARSSVILAGRAAAEHALPASDRRGHRPRHLPAKRHPWHRRS